MDLRSGIIGKYFNFDCESFPCHEAAKSLRLIDENSQIKTRGEVIVFGIRDGSVNGDSPGRFDSKQILVSTYF